MKLNSGQNLHQFLTNNRSNSQKSNSQNNKIYNNLKIYNQCKSNINIINIENANKRFDLFSNLNIKAKEKINFSKIQKADKIYYNNINLITAQNLDKKKEENKLNLNLSFLSNISKNKGNSFKTLDYDRSSYVRIMKYFTIKSSNKPMEFNDLSPVLIPIRNTLSNEHRKNNNLNLNTDNFKEKINFYYYINSKEKVFQLFKDNKKKNKYNSMNNKHIIKDVSDEKNNNINNSNKNINDCDKNNDKNKFNNINLINKQDQKNNNLKGSDNNLTFSKNSNESEFTFKDKGSVAFNIDSKKSKNKDNSNNSSSNILNSELNSFAEKDNKKINNNKKLLIKNEGKNKEIPENSGNCANNRLSISVEKINNKESIDNYNYTSKNKFKYNYNLKSNEHEKTNNNEDSPKFLNEKLFNNFINKENNKNSKDEKYSNLFDKILNNQFINKNLKLENDINSNDKISLHTIDNNENNDNKNNLKNSYQFRIRKINLPTGINLASIQKNNKLLQNLLNKKSKKNKGISNRNIINAQQIDYKLMKGEKMIYENRNKNLNNINEKKKNDKNNNLVKEEGKSINRNEKYK